MRQHLFKQCYIDYRARNPEVYEHHDADIENSITNLIDDFLDDFLSSGDPQLKHLLPAFRQFQIDQVEHAYQDSLANTTDFIYEPGKTISVNNVKYYHDETDYIPDSTVAQASTTNYVWTKESYDYNIKVVLDTSQAYVSQDNEWTWDLTTNPASNNTSNNIGASRGVVRVARRIVNVRTLELEPCALPSEYLQSNPRNGMFFLYLSGFTEADRVGTAALEFTTTGYLDPVTRLIRWKTRKFYIPVANELTQIKAKLTSVDGEVLDTSKESQTSLIRINSVTEDILNNVYDFEFDWVDSTFQYPTGSAPTEIIVAFFNSSIWDFRFKGRLKFGYYTAAGVHHLTVPIDEVQSLNMDITDYLDIGTEAYIFDSNSTVIFTVTLSTTEHISTASHT